MSNVLNKITMPADYRRSVNDPDYPAADWFFNPDVSAVVGVPRKYWVLGQTVTEMDASAKAAVDAAELAATQAASKTTAEAIPDDASGIEGYELRALVELFNKRDNYLVNRILELQAALDAMKASTGNDVSSLRDAIPATWLGTATRTRNDAITDYKSSITGGSAEP